MNSIYAVNTPYPQITGVCSPCDIRMIMDLYAGRTGELTSTTQYLYEHYVIDGIDEKISQTVFGLAKVEMLHHALFGRSYHQTRRRPNHGR